MSYRSVYVVPTLEQEKYGQTGQRHYGRGERKNEMTDRRDESRGSYLPWRQDPDFQSNGVNSARGRKERRFH